MQAATHSVLRRRCMQSTKHHVANPARRHHPKSCKHSKQRKHHTARLRPSGCKPSSEAPQGNAQSCRAARRDKCRRLEWRSTVAATQMSTTAPVESASIGEAAIKRARAGLSTAPLSCVFRKSCPQGASRVALSSHSSHIRPCIRTDHAEPKTAVSDRSDDQGDGKVAQRAMRRKAAAVRGRQNRPHTQPPSSFRSGRAALTLQVRS